jgi:hypothetical protein
MNAYLLGLGSWCLKLSMKSSPYSRGIGKGNTETRSKYQEFVVVVIGIYYPSAALAKENLSRGRARCVKQYRKQVRWCSQQ